MRFGEPTSPRPSGVTVAAFRPSPCSRIAAAASWTTRVVGRAARLEREIEARELELDPDHVGREHAEALLEQLLSRLVAFEDDDRLLVAHRRRCVTALHTANGMPSRKGRKGAFRYFDSSGKRIRDEAKLERIETARDPARVEGRLDLAALDGEAAGDRLSTRPAGSSTSTTRTTAPQQEQAKYDKLIRFGDALPTLRDGDGAALSTRRSSTANACRAVALRLIELGWFRVGSERYARDRDLRHHDAAAAARHGARPPRLPLVSGEARRSGCAPRLVDAELAAAIRELLADQGRRASSSTSGRASSTTSRASG